MQLKHRLWHRGGPGRQRGLSLVELMVGVVIGLIVVAAASMVMANNTVDSRRLVLEAQLQQDLRATADIITRELRRAGADIDPRSLLSVWYPEKIGPIMDSQYALPLTPASGATGSVTSFAYNPDGISDGVFGFALVSGVIQTQLLAVQPQDLTDSRAMFVQSFSISRLPDVSIIVPCAKA
jgi:prepilin-type N-terminal cleavage/methylation domain-containing protein